MWKNLFYITLGLYIYSSFGGLDVFYDSFHCFVVDTNIYKEFSKELAAEFLKSSEFTPIIQTVDTHYTILSSIKTYTLDEAIKITLEAIKNKSWHNNELFLKNVTENELIKNKLVFEQAYNNIYTLIKEQAFKMPNETK